MSAKHDLRGNVGIDNANPSEKLSVATDTDVSAEIGKAHIGYVGVADYAGFSHVDVNALSSYALLQAADGETFLNSASGQTMKFRIANSDKMRLFSNGNFAIGTTTDAGYKLDVNGDTAVRGTLYVPDTGGTLRAAIGPFDSNEIAFKGTRLSAYNIGVSGTGEFIGGSSPNNWFEVRGNQGLKLGISNGNSGYLRIGPGVVNSIAYTNTTKRTVSLEQSWNAFSGQTNVTFVGLDVVNSVNYTNDDGTSKAIGIRVNPTLTSVSDYRAIQTEVGKVIHQGLTNSTKSDVVYYDSSTGELTYGTAPAGSTPTLDAVTTTGNTTSNDIEVGGLNVDSGTLYVDSTNNRVGVGITSPSYPLEVSSSAAANVFGVVDATNANATAAWVAFNDQNDNVVYRIFGSGNAGVQMGQTLGRSSSLMYNGGGGGKFLVGTYSYSDYIMGTGNTERMRITTGGNILMGTTTDSGYKLDVNGTFRATTLYGDGSNLTGITATETDTLDTVTGRGATTTNSITVGGLDVNGTASVIKNEIDITPTSSTVALDIRGTGTPNDFFSVSNATGGANDVFLPIFFYKAATYGYNGGTNRYPSGVYGGGFIGAVDDASYPFSIGAGAAMHFNSRAYANNGPLYNRYLFSWGSWLSTYMTMTAGGNLLIGTTTDSGDKLNVNGSARIGGDLNAIGDFYQNGTQGWSGTINIDQSPNPPITITVQGGIITNVT